MSANTKNAYYVDCKTTIISQHPVVRTANKIVAIHFKGQLYDEAEARATKLAEILNRRAAK